MSKNLINYLTFILFIIPFTILIVDPTVLFPFITTKAITFRILTSLGIIFALWLYLLNPGTFPKKNLLILAVALYFLANILSTIFSVNPLRSFWGNAERMEGLWSLFFYLLYFFLLFTLFQFKPQAKKIIFHSFLIVTTIISLIEINQAFIQKLERPSATLGNATYIGFMNLLTIFLILYFLFQEKNFLIQTVYSSLILINLLSLIASQTRGSILGLLAGLFSFFIFYFLFSKIEIKKKILIFVLIFIFLISFYFFLKTDLALAVPGIKRIAETLQNPVSIFPRLYAWKIFLNAFLEKPIFGWGPETEPIAFFSTFDPKIFNYEQAIFDRPHNKFIEVLVKSGIFGFLTWFFIFFAFIYYLFQNKSLNLFQRSSLIGFLFAYFGQIFSLFDMQASYLLFFFGLSLIAEKIELKENRERFIRPYLTLIFGLSLISIIIHLQHRYIVKKIISYSREKDIKVAAGGFYRISQIAGPFLTEEAIMASNYFFNNLSQIKDTETFLKFYLVFDSAYQKDKYDYRLNNIYLTALNLKIQISRQLNLDYSKDIEEIKKIYSQLIKNYKMMPEIYLNFAKFLNSINEQKEAIAILSQGEKIFSNIYPRYLLEEGAVLLSFGEKDKAFEKLNLALKNNFQFRFDKDFENGLRIYLANKDVENSKKLISLWLEQNKSEFIRQNIKKILEEYNFENIINLDK